MKNITDLRNELTRVFTDLRSGNTTYQVAGELNNSCGKILSSLKVEMEYYALREEKPEIKFLSS